ncbi:MAG: GNAT family N-acetyltransferase [Clostridia bacterium]|nr:GNAT family N-acetyltransferase [Clostridia bacterium]
MEAGYIINPDYRRMGYAQEALSAVMECAFRAGVHRVYAECGPRNTASWKPLEKVGMQREAHFRQNIWFHKDNEGVPVWKDTFVYAILSTDKR